LRNRRVPDGRVGRNSPQTFLSGSGLLLGDEAIDAGDHHLGLAVDHFAL
jgi:hypothetical protein